MRNKLFKERSETVKTSTERWVRVFPDNGEGYLLFDPLLEVELGRILFDHADNWVYDGQTLNVYDQEEIAGFITGNHREMDELIKSVKEA